MELQRIECSSTDRVHEQSDISKTDEDTYSSANSDEKVYLDLRASSGYVKEAEKLERNHSKINLQITLKAAAR